MKFPRRGFLHLVAGAAALPIVSSIARAQAYPARTITLIVPFPPGGSTDVAARIVADHMSRTLGQQVIVQNVSGAGGTTYTADFVPKTCFALKSGGTLADGQRPITRCQ